MEIGLLAITKQNEELAKRQQRLDASDGVVINNWATEIWNRNLKEKTFKHYKRWIRQN